MEQHTSEPLCDDIYLRSITVCVSLFIAPIRHILVNVN